MWDPGFAHLRVFSARVLGWHRRFTLISTQSWGTEAAPGLCAVLHRGAPPQASPCRGEATWGRAFVVEKDHLDTALDGLDRREAAYLRATVWLEINDGGRLRRRQAVTYVADPGHPRLCADIGPERQAALVRQGAGAKGTSLAYLQNTVKCLAQDGHFRTDAHRFLAMVDANRGDRSNP